MFIKTQETSKEQQPENLSGQSSAKQEEEKLVNALSLYLQSIKANESQPEWIYGNSITLSSQISRFDIGTKLKEKAERLYPHSDEIARAIALLFEKQDRLEDAIEYYQKSVDLNPSQPEWVYTKLYNFLLQRKLLLQAENVRQQGEKYFPKSNSFQLISSQNVFQESTKVNLENSSTVNSLIVRETPKSIEHNVDLNVEAIRRQLMDSSIVENYEILLEQMICHVDESGKRIKTDALINCLAQIKTDIHYLKTKLLDPPAFAVDPQAKQHVDIEKIVNSSPAVPIKCELKNRIVGSGWHDAEKHGRWTGSGTLSSVVLPYPTAGKYRLEVIVKAEAKPGLLKSLRIHINDQLSSISREQKNSSFPAVIQSEITIGEQNQSFLCLDLTINETVNPQASDARLIGLLIESINLIPLT